MDTRFILYVFLDEKGDPFYVGFTKNLKRRMSSHMVEVRKMNCLPKYHKLRKLFAIGMTMQDIMVPVETDIPASEIDKKEIALIKELRSKGFVLRNLTDGGEGAIYTIPGLREKLRRIHLGSKRSEESKKRMSLARMGMVFSKEHKKNLSIARKKRIIKTETRAKCSKTSKGKINIKRYKLIDPEGHVYFTSNGLTLFCEEHGLTHSNIIKVCNGERPSHKGWKACRIENEETEGNLQKQL